MRRRRALLGRQGGRDDRGGRARDVQGGRARDVQGGRARGDQGGRLNLTDGSMTLNEHSINKFCDRPPVSFFLTIRGMTT